MTHKNLGIQKRQVVSIKYIILIYEIHEKYKIMFEIHTSTWSLSLEWMVLINFLKVFLRNFLIVSWATSKTFLNFWIFFTNLLQLSYKILSYKKKRVTIVRPCHLPPFTIMECLEYCRRSIWFFLFLPTTLMPILTNKQH